MELIAYRVHDSIPVDGEGNSFQIRPAARRRDWMDATHDTFAYRCLPLVIANQIGWFVTCPTPVKLSWDGGDAAGKLKIECNEYWKHHIVSHFGYGVVTFTLPWLFRLRGDPDMGLIVRGPTNMYLPRLVALDGYVEAAWINATFTMNWKMTEPGEAFVPQHFPICMITPFKAQSLESFTLREQDLSSDPEAQASYAAWSEARSKFIKRESDTSAGWQKHYFKGENVDGAPRAALHLSKLTLSPLSEEPGER